MDADDQTADDQPPADPEAVDDAEANWAEGLESARDAVADDMAAMIESATEALPDEAAMAEERVRVVAARYRLDDHNRSDLVDLVAAHRELTASGEMPDAKHLRGLRHAIGHDEVVVAACEVILAGGTDRSALDALHALALALLTDASGSAVAGAQVLLARCAEHDGDHRVMEAHIEDALAGDAGFWPALVDAAWFAEDRGDAVRAASLLTETHVPAYAGEVARLGRFIRSGDHKVGRNDPCPCGSGRKFKACCLNRGGFSLAERSAWLMDKAQGYLARPPQYQEVEALARSAAGDFARSGPEAYQLVLQEYPMVVEIALFEGGILASFLAQRGYLLPADEYELAESWLAAPLGIWRVTEIDDDGSNRSGPTVVLERDDTTIRVERPGTLIFEAPGTDVLARPLEVEGLGTLVLSGTALPPELIDSAAELLHRSSIPAEQLAGLVGVAMQIPPMTIDDGDPLVLCSVTYRLPEGTDPQEIADLLDRELLDVDESGEWIEPEDAPEIDDDPDWSPNGSVVLFEDEILVRAGSAQRADRLRSTVERLVDQAELVSDDRRTRAEVIEGLLDLQSGDRS